MSLPVGVKPKTFSTPVLKDVIPFVIVGPMRDILDKLFIAQDLIEIISSIDQSLIKSVKIFDVYEGENIPKDKKSIALNVTIQSSVKTLSLIHI